ncbi:hypothetical protein [Leifsonia sp. Le1]|uniref:hypothetical protein n=1 Tax=Leifsonia sp. Le1 TaxID=3404918 RepID=UPI003EBC56C3
MQQPTYVVDPATQVELVVPPFATPAETIDRAARERAGLLREVHFYPGPGNEWPLWEGSQLNPVTPESLGVSSELASAVRSWCERWEEAVGHGGDLRDEGTFATWADEGDHLVQRLMSETWPIADVIAEHR